ncbi:ABC transporter permease subunit, partial [Listeria monocytogenes]|uniref:ABC transporter permease subunit n=1 Tax=Listeria monocytogenes TaxID=1639 RepID=UPI00057EFD74
MADFIPTLAGYLLTTLYIIALSLIFGFILGVLLLLPRIYKAPILDQFASVYISFFRGTPFMVELFIVFYGIPALSSVFGIDLSQMEPLYAAFATYALSSDATIAAVSRAGVNIVDAGQAEAAYRIGLSSPP